jgi:hypothetical protein
LARTPTSIIPTLLQWQRLSAPFSSRTARKTACSVAGHVLNGPGNSEKPLPRCFWGGVVTITRSCAGWTWCVPTK